MKLKYHGDEIFIEDDLEPGEKELDMLVFDNDFDDTVEIKLDNNLDDTQEFEGGIIE